MDDVLQAALFSSTGAALVAIAGAGATIFGPAWRERKQRSQERIDASDAARYERALDFIESLTKLTVASNYADTRNAHVHWSRFVATLRPGEGPVGAYAKDLLKTVHGTQRAGLDDVTVAADKIFGWLRGDVLASEFEKS